jgi:glutaryl-CoA dehydrogenase
MFPIHTYGSDEQKNRWLPQMARAKAIGCFGLTEPDGGSDPGTMKTRAEKTGGDWVLSGAKMWITSGSIADVAVVWAMTENGVRGFLVEKGTPGYTTRDIPHKFSLRLGHQRTVLRQHRSCWRTSFLGRRADGTARV